jgi:pSer/pThr/pTyr-binding forkhead associated (FHA) protein
MSDELTNTEVSKNSKHINSILTKRGVLVIMSSNFLGKSYIIDKIKVIIGRQEDCDFVIADSLISKTHCAVIIDEDGKFFIEDLNSRNSTFLNGKELKKRTPIFYGDKIVIGNSIIRLYHEEKLDKK